MAYLPIGSSEASKAVVKISSANLDSFERLRTSSPSLVFNSRLLYDNQPLFWDDAVISGAGTSSTYNSNQSSVTLAVSNTTAGFRARQTFERFAYQPGSLRLGASIGGTRDVIVVAAARLTGTTEDFYASAVWQEF